MNLTQVVNGVHVEVTQIHTVSDVTSGKTSQYRGGPTSFTFGPLYRPRWTQNFLPRRTVSELEYWSQVLSVPRVRVAMTLTSCLSLDDLPVKRFDTLVPTSLDTQGFVDESFRRPRLGGRGITRNFCRNLVSNKNPEF